jgi:hypothetical protein
VAKKTAAFGERAESYELGDLVAWLTHRRELTFGQANALNRLRDMHDTAYGRVLANHCCLRSVLPRYGAVSAEQAREARARARYDASALAISGSHPAFRHPLAGPTAWNAVVNVTVHRQLPKNIGDIAKGANVLIEFLQWLDGSRELRQSVGGNAGFRATPEPRKPGWRRRLKTYTVQYRDPSDPADAADKAA